MNDKEKLIYIDTETSGVNCKVNGMLQLAGMIEIEGREVERFDYKTQPFPDDVIEHEALRVNNFTRRQIMEFDKPYDVYLKFIKMLGKYVNKFNKRDKFHFVGYNAGFDDGFLREWFKKNGDTYYGSFFWFPVIDVMGMAGAKCMRTRGTFPNFKLMTVAKVLGIEVDESKAHDAMYDVEITRDIFKLIREG
jgi:DNA polymerase-3 subunit epsilon